MSRTIGCRFNRPQRLRPVLSRSGGRGHDILDNLIATSVPVGNLGSASQRPSQTLDRPTDHFVWLHSKMWSLSVPKGNFLDLINIVRTLRKFTA